MYTLTTYDPGDGAAKGDFAVTVMKIVASIVSEADAPHGVNVQPSSTHGAKASKASSDGNLVRQSMPIPAKLLRCRSS